MEVKTVTDITTEPVSLATAKKYLKTAYGVDADADSLINSMITAARIEVEKHCNRSLGAKTLQMFWHFDELYDNRLTLPYGPHKTISEFYKIDHEGNETALTENTDYYQRGNEFLEIDLSIWGGSNPWSDSGILDYDFRLNVTAGYGTTGLESLPAIYKQAIQKQIIEWWVFRENYDQILSDPVKRILNRVANSTYL